MRFDKDGQYLEEICRLAQKKTELAARRAGEGEAEKILSLRSEIQEEEKEFFAAGETAWQNETFLPLAYLLEITGCRPFERHCVLMGLGYELGYPSQRTCVRFHANERQPGLTIKLLAASWQETFTLETVCEAFGEDGLLMQVFFERAGESAPFMEQPLCLKPRIRDFLLGSLSLCGEDAQVIGLCFSDEEMGTLDAGQPDVAGLLKSDTDVALVWGAAGSGRCFCARTACRKIGRRSFPVDLEEAWGRGWTPARTAERVGLESLLFQALPVLRLPRGFEDQEQKAWLRSMLRSLTGRVRPVFLISSRRPGSEAGELRVQSFEVEALSAVRAREVWKEEARAYAWQDGLHPEEMANLFHFTRGQIQRALQNAAADAGRRGGDGKIGRENLRRGCRSLWEQQLIKRAVRVPCVYHWEDLILPDSQKEKLRAAAEQVLKKHQVYEEWGFCKKMPYGQGVSMIFAGPPGTGKTMAAQVFAGELGLELYKVELSAVVSKYVGETEKNLNEIFRQAQKSRVVLFFDEADVLFSKRTEVKEANDKYSNMEAAFLLQKIETYDGVTVLATNLIQNFDEAFKRRMKFLIEFPFPGSKERREIWERAIPEEMPTEDLDYEYLAGNFELSGSNIRNCILHGAFLAAGRGKALGMKEILQGIKNEYAKNGKSLTREELGEYYMLLPEIG